MTDSPFRLSLLPLLQLHDTLPNPLIEEFEY
jgi:hypothetical protein